MKLLKDAVEYIGVFRATENGVFDIGQQSIYAGLNQHDPAYIYKVSFMDDPPARVFRDASRGIVVSCGPICIRWPGRGAI